MNHYELLYITSVGLDDKGREEVVQKVGSIISQEGNKITKQEDWGKRKLSYEINHEQHGWYMLAEFDAEKSALKKIEKNISLAPEVIRYLLVEKPVKTEEQLMKEKKIKEEAEARAKQKIEEIRPEETLDKKKEEKPVGKKISLEDLDKKLDEILEEDI